MTLLAAHICGVQYKIVLEKTLQRQNILHGRSRRPLKAFNRDAILLYRLWNVIHSYGLRVK